MGAYLHSISLGGVAGRRTLEQANRLVRILAAVTPGYAGRRVFFTPEGAYAVGAMGYVAAADIPRLRRESLSWIARPGLLGALEAT
jgi:hypothetical protein